MKQSIRTQQSFLRAFLVLLSALALNSPGADLAVDILCIPEAGGVFNFDVTIRNSGLEDVSIVSITDAPINDPLISSTLTTPVGFQANYDPLGFVDFLEDTELFGAGTTRSGFSFQSTSSPAANFRTFEAFTTGGDVLSGTITIVPEPTSGALLVAGLITLAVTRRRRFHQ